MVVKIKVIDLNNFIRLFDYALPKTKEEKIKLAKSIISKYRLPKRYFEGLDKEEKFLRQIELISKKRQPKEKRYETLKTDVIARKKGIPKTGTCTKRWSSAYPEAKSNRQKSKITGIPESVLKKVENKGRGAYYSSGSRPGQTSYSWGSARVNCFILNKPSVTKGPDRDLYEKAIQSSPRAKKWFSSQKY